MTQFIALLNHSNRVPDTDAATMARVIDTQLYWQFAPAWGLDSNAWRIAFYGATSTPPVDAIRLVLFDRPDIAGALGYHDVDPRGHPYGKVFVEPILDAGGGILDGIGASVSATASHEALEIPPDEYVNEWVEMPDGREVAEESCDPVEADSYILRLSVSGKKAQVSNFVTPNWFGGAHGPYDFLGRLTAPWQMSPGGYLIVRPVGGPVTNVWGYRYEEWRKAGKAHPAARTARRSAVRKPLELAAPEPPMEG